MHKIFRIFRFDLGLNMSPNFAVLMSTYQVTLHSACRTSELAKEKRPIKDITVSEKDTLFILLDNSYKCNREWSI